MNIRLIGLLLLLAACAPKLRFRDAPVIWYADDEHSIPKPKERKFAHIEYFVDILGFDRLLRVLRMPDLEHAHNVNAIDEVPNSTWFTNRIGVRPLSPAEVAMGPIEETPPQLPFVITSGKSGGRNPGFLAKDAHGRTYLVKFDRAANPDMQSGTNQIVNRIFWAIGYNVPEDSLVYLRPGDVSIGRGAKLTPPVGRKRKMTQKDLAKIFADSPLRDDGN